MVSLPVGTIDCRELVIGLSAILEGEDSFAKFVFDMFDEDGSGVLQPDEVENFTRVRVSLSAFKCTFSSTFTS